MTSTQGNLFMSMLAGALLVTIVWAGRRTAWLYVRIGWAHLARAYLEHALAHLEYRGHINTQEYTEVWWRRDYWASRIQLWESEVDDGPR